jgi:hypothetical protein
MRGSAAGEVVRFLWSTIDGVRGLIVRGASRLTADARREEAGVST